MEMATSPCTNKFDRAHFEKVAQELGEDMDAAQEILKKIQEAYEFDESNKAFDGAGIMKQGSVVMLTGLVKCEAAATVVTSTTATSTVAKLSRLLCTVVLCSFLHRRNPRAAIHNGVQAVIESYSQEKGRYVLKLPDGQQLAVKPQNIGLLSQQQQKQSPPPPPLQPQPQPQPSPPQRAQEQKRRAEVAAAAAQRRAEAEAEVATTRAAAVMEAEQRAVQQRADRADRAERRRRLEESDRREAERVRRMMAEQQAAAALVPAKAAPAVIVTPALAPGTPPTSECSFQGIAPKLQGLLEYWLSIWLLHYRSQRCHRFDRSPHQSRSSQTFKAPRGICLQKQRLPEQRLRQKLPTRSGGSSS